MDPAEQAALDEAVLVMREAMTLLPKRKDPQLNLVREFLGADEEGQAFDFLLTVGENQEPPEEFWDAVRLAGEGLGVTAATNWLSAEGQRIWNAHQL